MVPGLVIVTVAPWKSVTWSLPVLARRTRSSYALRKPAKSRVSACLMTGTTSVRVPSDFSMSTAMPTFTWSWWTTRGLPSASSTKVALITGMSSAIVRTTA